MKLEADDILLYYGERKVLQNICISVQTGEIVGLFGKNGCGKSSLLKVIYGMTQATTCCVRLDGLYVKKLYKKKNLVDFLPQAPFIPSRLKIQDAFSMYNSDLEIAKTFFPEITKIMNQSFGSFSAGQSRLFEALLVATSPAHFLLLDEPFSSIMPLHIEKFKALLTAIKPQKGIIVTDHYFQDVLNLTDRGYHLNLHGRLIALNDPLRQLEELNYIPVQRNDPGKN